LEARQGLANSMEILDESLPHKLGISNKEYGMYVCLSSKKVVKAKTLISPSSGVAPSVARINLKNLGKM